MTHPLIPVLMCGGSTNCFGMLSRDTGHSRVPAPPHIRTGISCELINIHPVAVRLGPKPASVFRFSKFAKLCSTL